MGHIFYIQKEFSLKLKALRKKADYSVLELARQSGISRQHIRDLELGTKVVTLKTLCKLANAFHIPMWKLIYFGNKQCRAM